VQGWHLSHDYSGAVKVVLREAVRFTEAWQPIVDFTQDDQYLEGTGPPSLTRCDCSGFLCGNAYL
jgi:hypothetical protein